jgi:opacity protein-like surface antigen
MKKLSIMILSAVLPLGAAFGVEFSLNAGGGGFLGGLFTRYTLNADGEVVVPVDVFSTQEINQINYGGYLFFDATFAEFSIGFHRGNNRWKEDYSADSDEGENLSASNSCGTGRELMLDLSLLGKYPFRPGERLAIFPLAGVEYQIALLEYRKQSIHKEMHDRTDGILEKDANGNAYEVSMWNSLLIVIGAGMDFALVRRMFLRTEFLYGFRLQTPYEVDALDKVKKKANAPDPDLGGLTSGPTLRLALGYRLWQKDG